MELFDIFQQFLTYSPLIADFLEAEDTDLLAFARNVHPSLLIYCISFRKLT